jgi:hypothetical protein
MAVLVRLLLFARGSHCNERAEATGATSGPGDEANRLGFLW